MAELSLSDASISTLASEMSDDEYAEPRSRSDSFGTSVSDDEERGHFHHDAVVSIFDSLKEGLSADVVQLELVGLRMSANASEHQVRRAVVTAFMKHTQRQLEEGPSTAGEAVKHIFTKYKDMLARIVFDRENDDEKPDQVDLLLLFQQDLVERNKGETILLFVAKELYDLEIVEEEAFEQWWEDGRSTATEALKKVRQQTQPFIDWLMEDDSEEDSDDDDDEESDE